MDADKIIEKTIEEGAKQSVGKLTEGISSFLSSICMPAAEEFGLYLRDRVAIFRATNLHRVVLKAQRRIEGEEGLSSKDVSPKLLKSIVDEAQWADCDAVQEMWAGLLSGAILSNESSDDSIIYVNQLKELSAYEARLLNLVYSDLRVASSPRPITLCKGFFQVSNKIEHHITTILDLSPKPLNYIVQNQSHDDILRERKNWSLALGFVKPQLESMVRRGLIQDWEETARDTIIFHPTPTGLDLYMRCSGYKVYPLEAYLLTRQHWAETQGLDPKTWKPDDGIVQQMDSTDA